MYFLFDIGGTKTRVAISVDKKTISDYRILDTPDNFKEGVRLIVSTAIELSKGVRITAICGGVGAPLNKEKRSVTLSYRNIDKSLSSWAGEPLYDELENKLGAPVFLENDASIIGIAEAAQIENYKSKIIAYYTVSTGVGGSLINYGKIAPNKFGFEPGNQIIDPSQTLCPNCEKPGRLEDLIGGNYIKKRTGKLPEEINDKDFWNNIEKFLAIGLINSTVHWSPDIIILGGSLMRKISIENIKRHFKEKLLIYPELPEIRLAKLENLGGLEGAITFLNSKLENN